MHYVRLLEWFTPSLRDDDKQRITRLLSIIIWTFGILDGIYLAFSLLLRDAVINIGIAGGLLGLMVILHQAVKQGWIRATSLLLTFGVWGIFASSIFSGLKVGIEDPLYSGFILVVLLAGFLLSTRMSLLIAGMSSVVGLIAIIWLASVPTSYPFSNTVLDWAIYSAFLVIGAVLLHLANQSIRDALERTRAGERRLAERNTELQCQIQERERAEEALREKNERFRLAMKAARMRTWDWNFQTNRLIFPDSHTPMWNPPIETYDDFLNGLQPEDQAAVQKALDRALNEDAPYVVEHRTPLSDGTIGWVEALGRLYRDDLGKPIGLVGISKDITERRRAEDSLRKREELAREFQERLKALQEVSIILGQSDSLDELYRQAVKLGRERLGFDRLAIFLYEADTKTMVGTFGTDATGQLRDERYLRVAVEQAWILETLASKNRLSYRLDVPLYNDVDVVIGHGWNVMAPIWRGETIIAWIAIDNFTRQEPLHNDLLELTSLYASTLGHLIIQKKAEQAVREYDERLTLALKAAQMRTWDWNIVTGQISAQDFRGFSWSHVTTYEQFLEQVHPADRETVRQDNLRSIAENQPYVAEYRICLPDGSFRWSHSLGLPYQDRTGKIVGMVGVSQDVTERREAEEALRRSEERFQQAFQANPSAIAITTIKDERFIAVNDSWVQLFGYTPEDMIGRTSSELNLWVLDPERQAQYTQTILENGSIRDIEIVGRTKSGEQIFVMALAEKIEFGGESYYLTMLQDITQRKEAEKQALELTLQKERIAMLTEFMGNITHDLKTPLSIINTSTYLAERLTDPDKRREKFNQIKQQVSALEKFIQDILTILRLDYAPALQNQSVDLNAMLTDVVNRLRSTADQKQVEMSLQLDATESVLNGDPQELDRALVNLVENAVNYTLSGGAVRIHTYRKTSRLIVEVTDTGIGVNEAAMSRIFERFYRTDEARSAHHGGSGLGLAIVKRIVEMHGGNIEVESTIGVGSTFRVCFPNSVEL